MKNISNLRKDFFLSTLIRELSWISNSELIPGRWCCRRDVHVPPGARHVKPLRPRHCHSCPPGYFSWTQGQILRHCLLPGSSEGAHRQLLHGQLRLYHHLHDYQQIHLYLQTYRLSEAPHFTERQDPHHTLLLGWNPPTYSSLFWEQSRSGWGRWEWDVTQDIFMENECYFLFIWTIHLPII